jgi:two-component system KDP operon response regulator KdpE
MACVLLIDDNALDRKIARDALGHADFAVEEAADGAAGLRQFYESRPDVVVLDVLMPTMDGWMACARIRELSAVPIIMLTSLDREEEMIRGLDLGADDFVSKPVSPAHLVARVRAVLRRAREPTKDANTLLYRDDRLCIDAAEHRVARDGRTIELTPTEFKLLVALAGAPDRVHSYSMLLSTIWGPEYLDDVDFLRVYVWRLRKKLEPDPGNPRWLLTRRGFGYRFAGHQPGFGGTSS